jgi:hypothetical protein
MATRWYAINPGQSLENVSEAIGNGNSSAIVELNINLSTTGITDLGASPTTTSRIVTKAEVLQCLEMIKEQIVRDTSGVLS